MKIVNRAQPFNVGDQLPGIQILPADLANNLPACIATVTVASWRPRHSVHGVDPRGRSVQIPWQVAVDRLDEQRRHIRT